MHLQTMHLIPQEFDGARVLADDNRSQLGEHQPCGIGPYRPRSADDAFVGFYIEKILHQAQMLVVDLFAALSAPTASVFRIDVNRAQQPLFPKRPVGFHRAGQLPETNIGNLHGSLGSLGRHVKWALLSERPAARTKLPSHGRETSASGNSK